MSGGHDQVAEAMATTRRATADRRAPGPRTRGRRAALAALVAGLTVMGLVLVPSPGPAAAFLEERGHEIAIDNQTVPCPGNGPGNPNACEGVLWNYNVKQFVGARPIFPGRVSNLMGAADPTVSEVICQQRSPSGSCLLLTATNPVIGFPAFQIVGSGGNFGKTYLAWTSFAMGQSRTVTIREGSLQWRVTVQRRSDDRTSPWTIDWLVTIRPA